MAEQSVLEHAHSQLNMETYSRQLNTHEYLLPDEVASLLRLSRATVYRMVEKREVPFYRLKGGLRFLREDVEKYMQDCRVKSKNEYEYGSKTKI